MGFVASIVIVDIWFMYSITIIILGLIALIVIALKYDHNVEATFMLATSASIVLGLSRLMYIDAHVERTITDSSPLREIQFADDSKTMTYKSGMTETRFSKVYSSKEGYFEDKATYLQRYLPDRNDTYQENCYHNKYNYKYSWFYDENITLIECY